MPTVYSSIFSQLFFAGVLLATQFIWMDISHAEAPYEISGAETIDLMGAYSLYQSGAVFIDVRDAGAWSLGHIDGAVNLDFNDDMFVILYVSDELDKETPLVFYSDSALGPSAAMASFFAASWGYKNVHYFRDGYYAWMASDLPVELQFARQLESPDLSQEGLATISSP